MDIPKASNEITKDAIESASAIFPLLFNFSNSFVYSLPIDTDILQSS